MKENAGTIPKDNKSNTANKLSWENGKSYRIPGKTYPKQKIVVFDLTAYEKIEGRKTFTIQKVPISGGDLIK